MIKETGAQQASVDNRNWMRADTSDDDHAELFFVLLLVEWIKKHKVRHKNFVVI